ncbi:hypothetical protein EVG20_g5649 [Dentipellis fragilis]|uniref:F-box domain-containing protein n=1 Tax=Dentipellis fragilis TaxID=205917 RepID=A0A4Y9YSD4_9AGAM|nr:hypothetical protein EVG20_g5649 [Dentipellis fragilis]
MHFLLSSAIEYWRSAEHLRLVNLTETIAIGHRREILQARSAMEAEVEAVNLTLSSLRSRCNMLSSIGQLPTEVLIQIFHALRLSEPPKYLPKNRHYPASLRSSYSFIGWFKVTHVCRQWRNTALAYPSIWSDIAFDLGPKWRDETLRRSETAPISIKWGGYNPYMTPDDAQDMPNILVRHLEHTKELSLSADAEDWAPLIPPLCGDAPLLERAALITSTNLDRLPSLPSDLFGQHSPRLRRLHLRGWIMSWSPLTMNFNLTHLKVELDYGNPRDFASDFTDFLRVIGKLQSLESLVLVHSMPILFSTTMLQESYSPNVTIHLPKLRNLVISDDILACAVFLKHTVIPSTATHQIHCYLTGKPIEHILPWVNSKIVSVSSPIRKLAITDIKPTGIHIMLWDETLYDEDHGYLSNHETPPVLDLSITGSTWDHSTRALIQSICEKLPLGSLKVLSIIDRDTTWSVQDWFDTFRDLSKVSEVEIGLACAPSFCEALSKADTPHSNGDRLVTGAQATVPLLPSLESLVMTHVTFSRTLLAFLEDRTTLRPLKRLEIKKSDVDDGMIKDLEKVIPVVGWDEKRSIFDSSGSDSD